MNGVNAIEGGDGLSKARSYSDCVKALNPETEESKIPLSDDFQPCNLLRMDLLEVKEKFSCLQKDISNNQIGEEKLNAIEQNLQLIKNMLEKIESPVCREKEKSEFFKFLEQNLIQNQQFFENSSIAGVLTQNQNSSLSNEDLNKLGQLRNTLLSDEGFKDKTKEILTFLKSAVQSIKDGKTIYDRKLEALGKDSITLNNQSESFLICEKDIRDIGTAQKTISQITSEIEENPKTAELSHDKTIQTVAVILLEQLYLSDSQVDF